MLDAVNVVAAYYMLATVKYMIFLDQAYGRSNLAEVTNDITGFKSSAFPEISYRFNSLYKHSKRLGSQ